MSDFCCAACGEKKCRPAGGALSAGYICGGCGLFHAAAADRTGHPPALIPAPPTESNESVYRLSKKGLFAGVLKKLAELKPSRGRLMDVGCGFGYFMKSAEHDGWRCEGVEISPAAAEHARRKLGLRVYERPLGELKLPGGCFDAAALWGVLDVMPDPSADLKEVCRVLKPGGVVYIRVNNFAFHRPAFLLGRLPFLRRLKVSPGVIHRYGFGRKSLAALLESSGFEAIKIAAAPPTSGDPYGTGGKLGGAFVSVFKKVFYAFALVLSAVTGRRLIVSSALEAWARKKDVRPKILCVITRLDMGGSSQSVMDILARLDSRRYRAVLAYGKSVLAGGQDDTGRIYLPSLVREINPLKDAAAFVSLVKLFLGEKPDIVHTHSSKAGILGRWAAFAARILSRGLKKTKIIHSPHGHIFYGYYGRFKSAFFLVVERLTAFVTDVFVALTEGEKTETLARGVGRASSWRIVHSGVDEKMPARSADEVRRELGIPSGALTAGTVARLEKVKGAEYFIRSVPAILKGWSEENSGKTENAAAIRFIVVGDGSLRAALESLSEKLGVRDSVIFAGARDDVPDLINSMDVYVQPSLNEGMGRAIVEAMYLAKPVVASEVQGIPDLVKNGKTGILVPPSDPASLARALLKLFADKELRRRLGSSARTFSAEAVEGGGRFSAARMIYLYEKLYDSALGG